MKGIVISEGFAIGTLFVVEHTELQTEKFSIQDPQQEIMELNQGVEVIRKRLQERMDLAMERKDQARADVYSAHLMMCDDPELFSAVEKKIIDEKINASYALKTVTDQFIELFEAMDNAYLRERSHDIKDLRNQILSQLSGLESEIDLGNYEHVILVAEDFSPSDIHYTEMKQVMGFAAEKGAATTHFAILAKISGIPTVLGVKELLKSAKTGDFIILDGLKGELLINPSEEEIALYQKQKNAYDLFKEELKHLIHKESVTADGHHVQVFANIAGIKDGQKASENGADGVGLFRTEFIYMDRQKAPSEEEQFEIYREVLLGMKGKPVVIRTLDVGGDKELTYLNIPKEDNPFLGYRAVRYCLVDKALFRTQLRALLRASIYGDLHIMVPMISCIEEVLETKALLEEVKMELITHDIAFSSTYQLGIMIEVPSAALSADLLAEEVDFFSIGTNDLIQYTMAVDRMNESVSHLYNPYQASFLRVLKLIIDGAHLKGIKVAMCGELAADKLFIPVLIGLGLDELSMNINSLLSSRHHIRLLDYQACCQLTEKLLKLTTSAEIKETLIQFSNQ